jgi:hypothetical protein
MKKLSIVLFVLLSTLASLHNSAGMRVASPKLILGPEVSVSANQDGGQLRCEPSAAIFKETVIVAWNDSHGGARGASTGVSIGWAISNDRGKTFRFGGYLPDSVPPSGADSWLMSDKDGDFYLELLEWQKESQSIHLYRMDHNAPGRWQRMKDAVFYDQKLTGRGFVDKPAMWVDSNRVAIVYAEETNAAEKTIGLALSLDGGKSWKPPVQLSDKSKKLKTGASVTMAGDRIVVSWMESERVGLDQIWYAASKDGGQTFTHPALIYDLKESLRPPKGYSLGVGPAGFISNNVWLTSIHSVSGSTVFYLTCAEGSGPGSDVLLFRLTDGEVKWSQPARIDGGQDSAMLFPALTRAGAMPAVLYYYRGDADSTLTDVYLSAMLASGRFESMRINTKSTDWTRVAGDKQNAPVQRNFGDYITLASSDNLMIATWTDGRDGVPRIYARVIEVLD